MTELVANVIEFMAAKRDMTDLYPCVCVLCIGGMLLLVFGG